MTASSTRIVLPSCVYEKKKRERREIREKKAKIKIRVGFGKKRRGKTPKEAGR